ncbi:hypothetical protein COY27_04280 [Candidatus Woesearchaeota archaeon CG_4_10_14_0_2_um_filter_33_13]|nr:MAG: hypothetical protein COY27_04280 [Candidatus Woesearchaeota archaeon CG_4_10_14_0_2_um_filter_33_13]
MTQLSSEEDLVVKFWGTRGSLPAPLDSRQVLEKQLALIERIIADGGTDKLFRDGKGVQEYLAGLSLSYSGTYGGETTCIEVQARDSPLIVIDSGSGIRRLGNTLISRLFSGQHLNPLCSDEATARELHLFLTHYHWDHIQGFPFFKPAFVNMSDKRLDITFYGKRDARKTLSGVLHGQQEYPNFPIIWDDVPCTKAYRELGRMNPEDIQLGRTVVKFQELTHPDSVLAYRVDVNGKAIVCATDTEHKDSPDPRLVRLAKGADLLYYDGQFTPEEYRGDVGINRLDWGHSTFEWAIRNALAADVSTVVIGHHSPDKNDFDLDKVYERALDFKDQQLKLVKNDGKSLNVLMAYDGLEQRF